jgi:hypothetical protein
MILYLKDPKASTRKILHSVNMFDKVARYKINMQKNSSVSIHWQWTQWKRSEESNLIHNRFKNYLGINLTKNVKDLNNKNNNESEEEINWRRY